MNTSGDFSKFGTVSYTKETRITDFIKNLESGKILGTRCRHCSTLYFPPQIDCPTCLKGDMAWENVPAEGQLISYSVMTYGPAGFEDKTPYALGVARLGDDVQVLALVSKDIPEREIKIGMKVRIVPTRPSPDRISYEFQKA